MIWVDRIAKELTGSTQHIDDMFTPSGYKHAGSLLGPVLHDVVYKVLKTKNADTVFTYVINDFDPIDGLSADLQKDFAKYLGYPLRLAPSPDPKFKNFAQFFTHDFLSTLEELAVNAQYLFSWDMYHQGKFNDVIKTALDNGPKILEVYRKIGGYKSKPENWYPLQVICPKCSKLGTTKVTKWDGKLVEFTCEEKLVDWAKGCGYQGKISPFDGNGKLPWKVDWPAHWKVLGVTFEGAGKDHASKGGSYDIAFNLCEEVFQYPKPYHFPYEFFLFGGKKMSSSKGIGIKASGLTSILPAEIARFLLIRTSPKKTIEFDPQEGMTIPALFDEFDRCANAFWENSDPDLARIFELSQVNDWYKNKQFLPRFIDIAKYTKNTKEEIISQFTSIKEKALTESEIKILESRIKYAQIWLEKFAPLEYQELLTTQISKNTVSLTLIQQSYLKEVIKLLDVYSNAEKLQLALYEKTKKIKISPKAAFSAIYSVIIGKNFGPKAGSLLLQFPKEKIISRINEVIK